MTTTQKRASVESNAILHRGGLMKAGLNTLLIATCSLGLCLSFRSSAIDYVFTGTGSGPLGSSTFNTSFQITLTLNPANYFFDAFYNSPAISNVTGRITLQGVGTATFLDPLTVVGHGSGYGEIMIGDGWRTPAPYLNFLLAFECAHLVDYNLTSPIGPVNAEQIMISNSPVHTPMGDLYFDRVNFPLTFQAVPEPSIRALIILATPVALLLQRRKAKNKNAGG
jgi:hypothetical protein